MGILEILGYLAASVGALILTLTLVAAIAIIIHINNEIMKK